MRKYQSTRLARPRQGRMATGSAVTALGVSTSSMSVTDGAKATPTTQQSRPSGPVNQVRSRARIAGEAALVSPRPNQAGPDGNSPTIAKLGIKREMVEDSSAQAALSKTAVNKVLKSDVNASAAAGPGAGRIANDSKVGISEQRNIENSSITGACDPVTQPPNHYIGAVPADNSLDRPLVLDQCVSQVETAQVEAVSHPPVPQSTTETTAQHLRNFEFCDLKVETVGEDPQAVSRPSQNTTQITVQYPGNGENFELPDALIPQKTAYVEHQAHDRHWLLQKLLLVAPDSELKAEIRFPGILKSGPSSPTIQDTSPRQPEKLASGLHNISLAGEDTHLHTNQAKQCNKGEDQGVSGAKLNPGATAEIIYNFVNGVEAYDQGSRAAALEDRTVSTTTVQKNDDHLSKRRNSPALSSPSASSLPEISVPLQKSAPDHVRKENSQTGSLGYCVGREGQKQPEKKISNHDKSEGYKQGDPRQDSDPCSSEYVYQREGFDCRAEEDQRVLRVQHPHSGNEALLLQQVECSTERHEERCRSESLHPTHHLEHRGEHRTLYAGTGSLSEMPTCSVRYTEPGYQAQLATRFHNFLRVGVREENGSASLPVLRGRVIHGILPTQGGNASIQCEANPVNSGSVDGQLQDGYGHVFSFFPQAPGVEVQNRIIMTLDPNSGHGRLPRSHSSAIESIAGVANAGTQDGKLIAGQPPFEFHSNLPVRNLNQWLPNKEQVADHQSFDSYDIRGHPHRPFRRHGKLHSSPNSRFVPFSGNNVFHRRRPSVARRQDAHPNGNGDGSHMHSFGSVSPLRSLMDRNHSFGPYVKGKPITLATDLQNQANIAPLLHRAKEELVVDNSYTKKRLDIHPNQLVNQQFGNAPILEVPEVEEGMPLRDGEKITSSKSPIAYGFKNACDSLYPPDLTMSMLRKFKLQDFPMWIDHKDEMQEIEILFCEGISFSMRKRTSRVSHVQHLDNKGMSLSDSFQWRNFGHNSRGESDIMPCFLPSSGITADFLTTRKRIYQAQLDEIDDWYMDFRKTLRYMNRIFDTSVKYPISKCYAQFPLSEISRRLRRYRDGFVQHFIAVKEALGEEPIVSGFSARRRARRATSTAHNSQNERLMRTVQLATLQSTGWRPHRGLPDRAVSVLKSWLFGNFLHPYPKDADKELLAKATGLTRGQVSNWFINARVRIWKPMIEDMYRYEYPNGSGTQVTVVANVRPEVVLDGGKKPLMLKALLPNVDRPPKRHCIHRSFPDREQNGAYGMVPPAPPNSRAAISIPPQFLLARRATILPASLPNSEVGPRLPPQTLKLMDGCKPEFVHQTERSRGSVACARDGSTGSRSSDANVRAFAPKSREVLARFLTTFEVQGFSSNQMNEFDPSFVTYMVKKCYLLSRLGMMIPNSGASESRLLPPGIAALSQVRIELGEPGDIHSVLVPELLSPDELVRIRKGKCNLVGVV